ncbi:MAG: hypothetical protein ACRDON_07275 [Gaiellaceae bacterium]
MDGLLIDCPETGGLHAGHVVLNWLEDGVYVTVSSHDHTDRNRRLVLEVAEEIEMVGPMGAS